MGLFEVRSRKVRLYGAFRDRNGPARAHEGGDVPGAGRCGRGPFLRTLLRQRGVCEIADAADAFRHHCAETLLSTASFVVDQDTASIRAHGRKTPSAPPRPHPPVANTAGAPDSVGAYPCTAPASTLSSEADLGTEAALGRAARGNPPAPSRDASQRQRGVRSRRGVRVNPVRAFRLRGRRWRPGARRSGPRRRLVRTLVCASWLLLVCGWYPSSGGPRVGAPCRCGCRNITRKTEPFQICNRSNFRIVLVGSRL
jgi:hypothetical protein